MFSFFQLKCIFQYTLHIGSTMCSLAQYKFNMLAQQWKVQQKLIVCILLLFKTSEFALDMNTKLIPMHENYNV